jgi:glucokinase
MVEAVGEALAAAGEVRAVGFGIPSLLDFASGTSIASVHLPLDGVPFRDLMSHRLGLPVFVDNDANLAALAEQRLGAARGLRHVVMLTIGTGIGGAVIVDGRLVRGATGAAGELGHVTIALDGPPCSCPNRGCLETLVSGPAIGREGERVAAEQPTSALGRALARGVPVTGELVTTLAHEGDLAARTVLELVGRRLGAGLVGMVNTFNPEAVVIGGGASRAGDLLLDPAREVVAARALRPSRDAVRILRAAFGEDAGVIGAAAFARESLDVGPRA